MIEPKAWQLQLIEPGSDYSRESQDASLDPVYSVNHAPYGELWNAQGSSPMPFGFTGEWQDDNDLLFLRARYYNPAQAAFLSLDPIEGGLSDVQALNRYGYVQANPANFVDPTGMVGELPPIGCGGGFPEQSQDDCSTLDLGGLAEQKCNWLERLNIRLTAAVDDPGVWGDHHVEDVYDSVSQQARSMFCVYAGCYTELHANYNSPPPPLNVVFFNRVFQKKLIEIEMRGGRTTFPGVSGGGSAYTHEVNGIWRIEIARNGRVDWSDLYPRFTFGESLIAHEMGHIFSNLYRSEMQEIGVQEVSLAQQIVDYYVCTYKNQCTPDYRGELAVDDWDIIAQLLPVFSGGNTDPTSPDYGRNWSRAGGIFEQYRELAAEAYAAWSLGYLRFDVTGLYSLIKDRIENIIKRAGMF